MRNVILVTLLLSSLVAQAQDDTKYFCTVDEAPLKSVFYCLNKDTSETSVTEVEPIEQSDIEQTLKDNGVTILKAEDYLGQTLLSGIKEIRNAGQSPFACFQQIKFEPTEFNALAPRSAHLRRVHAVAKAMKAAGVCQATMRSDNSDLGLGIRNHDDLLQHFLCVSNYESTFGRDNIGMGGRGPWGINPDHVKNGGLCDDLRAVVGENIKSKNDRNALYSEQAVRVDNATCALRLYKKNGYRDWGTSSTTWGSNHSCSQSQRQRFHLEKALGIDACCTQACRQRVLKNSGQRTTSI